jgi:ATP-dependent exoDNAse (exonuclease V) beta subunit
VAATRAREHLILSGVVKPEAGSGTKPSTPVVERLVAALGVERDADAVVSVPAPEPRPGLEASFAPGEIAVRVNLPSPERAAELTASHRDAAGTRPPGDGPPPLTQRDPPVVPNRPLSYTAIAAFEECAYRFYMERVLGLPPRAAGSERIGAVSGNSREGDDDGSPSAREERSARGAAVHALLEWSQANGWLEPTPELAERHAAAAGLDPATTDAEGLLAPVRDWLGSPLREEIAGATAVRAEAPLLLGVGETVLRGSIDLLVERADSPPLVIDYKTDRLGGADPAERAGKYEIQRSVYALATAGALGTEEVEVAYVFLERAEEPALSLLGKEEMDAGRLRLETAIGRITAGEFPVAPEDERSWDLCRGCPALGRLCSGPEAS